MTQRYTVGVATYRRSDHVERLFDSLLQQSRLPEEVIVVDDSPEQQVRPLVEELDPAFAQRGVAIEYNHREGNTGLPGARNTVIERSTGDRICFLDDDTECAPGWLRGVHDGFEQYPEAVSVGGPAIDVDETGTPLAPLCHTDENINMITSFGWVRDHSHRWVPSQPIRTHHLRGANMAFEKDVLDQLDGFDQGYQGNHSREESDIFAQLQKRGDTVVYHPDARVDHFKAETGGTRTDSNAQRAVEYWTGRNHVRFLSKHFPDRFVVAVAWFVLHSPHKPAPLWKQLLAAIRYRDTANLLWLKGVLAGLRETGIILPGHD